MIRLLVKLNPGKLLPAYVKEIAKFTEQLFLADVPAADVARLQRDQNVLRVVIGEHGKKQLEDRKEEL